MSRPSPNIEDVRYMDSFLQTVRNLEPEAGFALVNLVSYAAGKTVWTYSAPGEAKIPDDDRTHLVAGLSKAQWKKIRGDILEFFDAREGWLYLNRTDWFYSSVGNGRPSVPPYLRITIGERDDWTCGYCGTKEGPFDLDHVIPLSKGGHPTDPDNLLCACARCNRSKSDKFVSEWIS